MDTHDQSGNFRAWCCKAARFDEEMGTGSCPFPLWSYQVLDRFYRTTGAGHLDESEPDLSYRGCVSMFLWSGYGDALPSLHMHACKALQSVRAVSRTATGRAESSIRTVCEEIYRHLAPHLLPQKCISCILLRSFGPGKICLYVPCARCHRIADHPRYAMVLDRH